VHYFNLILSIRGLHEFMHVVHFQLTVNCEQFESDMISAMTVTLNACDWWTHSLDQYSNGLQCNWVQLFTSCTLLVTPSS